MPSDETRCAWKSRYTGAVCNEPEQTRHHWHESLRQFCDMQCDNDNLDCHPFAPSAPPAEVECDTDYGIEGVGLPPLQCDCHKDGDPRHCSKCINHSWGKAGARPAEVEPHPWYGPCDGFRADGGCSECARVAGAPADPQPEREMTEDEAFAAYWGASSRADEYQEKVARQAWKARGAYEAGRRGR
jgi:hypothetical protein